MAYNFLDFNEASLPTGFDRAGDGSTIWGTPDPDASQISIASSTGRINVEELPDSPEIEYAEQGTVSHRFHCSWDEAVSQMDTIQRGTYLQDSYGNWSKVLSIRAQPYRAGLAVLTIVSEFIGINTPADEFDLSRTQLNIDILKHPRYFFALDPTLSDKSTTITVSIGGGSLNVSLAAVKQGLIRAVQTYRDSPFFPSADNINGLVQSQVWSSTAGSTNIIVNNASFDITQDVVAPVQITASNIGTYTSKNCPYFVVGVPNALIQANAGIQLAQAAAQEVIQKIWRLEDTPYIAGIQMTHSVYYYVQQKISPGGYIENPFSYNGNVDAQGNSIPVADPPVPEWFWSTSFPPDSSGPTIFDNMGSLNPTCYSNNGQGGKTSISWLRQGDTVHYERTWYKVTRTWIGSPVGHWDYQLYGGKNVPRPQTSTQYVTGGL